MTEKEALELAIARAGSQVELARKLTQSTGKQVTQPVISMWLTRYGGRASPLFCRPIEKLTGVAAADLRPDYYGECSCEQQ